MREERERRREERERRREEGEKEEEDDWLLWVYTFLCFPIHACTYTIQCHACIYMYIYNTMSCMYIHVHKSEHIHFQLQFAC